MKTDFQNQNISIGSYATLGIWGVSTFLFPSRYLDTYQDKCCINQSKNVSLYNKPQENHSVFTQEQFSSCSCKIQCRYFLQVRFLQELIQTYWHQLLQLLNLLVVNKLSTKREREKKNFIWEIFADSSESVFSNF